MKFGVESAVECFLDSNQYGLQTSRFLRRQMFIQKTELSLKGETKRDEANLGSFSPKNPVSYTKR